MKYMYSIFLLMIASITSIRSSFDLDRTRQFEKLKTKRSPASNIDYRILLPKRDSFFYEAYNSNYSHEKYLFFKKLEDKKKNCEDCYKTENEKRNYATSAREIFRELNSINVYLATTQNPKFPEDWEIVRHENKVFNDLKKSK